MKTVVTLLRAVVASAAHAQSYPSRTIDAGIASMGRIIGDAGIQPE